ncbi:LamG-like jellyroll fold domain-containing protein [Haloferula sp.]|uniref:LamG-like jellyroll fold domain-containing protein n=1 Tax=Haloferula sp. TaxID=2497595 RepID=UPI003C74F62E
MPLSFPPRGSSTALYSALLIAACFSSGDAETVQGELIEFTAPSRQPLFGEDAFLNVFKQYMVEINVAEEVGKTVTVDYLLDEAKFGGKLSAGVQAAFGLEIGLCVGGSADYQLAFQPSISVPDSYPFGLAIPLTVSEGFLESYQVGGGPVKMSGFSTEFPPFPEAYADLIFDLRAQLKANACVFSCFDAVDIDFWNCDPDYNPKFPAGASSRERLFKPSTRCDPTLGDGYCAIEIASFNRDDSKKVRMLNFNAGNATDFWKKPYLESSFDPMQEIPIGPTGDYGSLKLDVPTVNSTSVGSLFNTPDTLRSSGTGDLMNLQIKVLDIIADLIPVKTMPPLEASISQGPLKGSYDLATLDIGPAIQLQTDFEMTWDLVVTQITFTEPGPSTSPRSVRLVWPTNSPSYDPAGQLVSGQWRPDRQANEIVLLTNCDGNPDDTCFALPAVSLINEVPVEIEITYELRPKLEALVSLPFIGQLDYAALKAGISVDYVGKLDFGPLVEGAHKFKFGEFTVFDGPPNPLASRGEGKLQFTMQAFGPADFQWRNDLASNNALGQAENNWIAPYGPGDPTGGMETNWRELSTNTQTAYPGAPGSVGSNLARIDSPLTGPFGPYYWPRLQSNLEVATLKVANVRPDGGLPYNMPELSLDGTLGITGGLLENTGTIVLRDRLEFYGEVGTLCGPGTLYVADGSIEAPPSGDFTLCNFNTITGGGEQNSETSAILNAYRENAPSSLIYYWDFDSPILGPGLTTSGFAGLVSDGRSGNPGDQSLNFPNVAGSTARLSNLTALNTAAAADTLTIAYWSKLNASVTPGTAQVALYGYSPSNNPTLPGLQIYSPATNKTLFYSTLGFDPGTQRTSSTAQTAVDFLDWHHVAFVKNGPIRQIWLDGEMIAQDTNALPMPSDFSQFWIGRDVYGEPPVANCRFDDFAIFDRALSETTIKQLAGVIGGAPQNPAAGLKPNELPEGWSVLNNMGTISANPIFDAAPPGGRLQTNANEIINQGTLRSQGTSVTGNNFRDGYTYSLAADRFENREGSRIEAVHVSGGIDLRSSEAKHSGLISATEGGLVAIAPRPTDSTSRWDAGQSFTRDLGFFRASGTETGALGVASSTIQVIDTELFGGCLEASNRGAIEATNAMFCGSMFEIGDVTEYFLSLRQVLRVEDLPSADQSVVIVALVGGNLHVRAFDRNGNVTIDVAEGGMLLGPDLDSLKKLLGTSPPPSTSDFTPPEQLAILLAASRAAKSPLVNDLSGSLSLTDTLLDRVSLINHGTVEAAGMVESVNAMLLANAGKLSVLPGGHFLIRENVTPVEEGEVRQPGIANATPESLLGGTWDIAGNLEIEGAQFIRTGANAAYATTESGAFDETQFTTGEAEAPGSRQLSLGQAADITLRGPAWTCAALDTLQFNGGRLAVVDGASFSPNGTPGSGFVNAGQVSTGSGSTLTVDGVFLQRGEDSRTSVSGSVASSTKEFAIMGGTVISLATADVLNISGGVVAANSQLTIEAPLRDSENAAIDPVTGFPESGQEAVTIILGNISVTSPGSKITLRGKRAEVAGDEGIYFPALEKLTEHYGQIILEGTGTKLALQRPQVDQGAFGSELIEVGAGAVLEANTLNVSAGAIAVKIASRPEQGQFGRIQLDTLNIASAGELLIDLFPDAAPGDVTANFDLGDSWKIITGPAGSGAAPTLTGNGFGLPGQFNDVVYRIRGLIFPSGQIPGSDYRLDLVPFNDTLRNERGYAVKVVPNFGSAFMDYTTWATDVRMINPLGVLANPSQDTTGNGYSNANEFFFQAVQHQGTTELITPTLAASGQPQILEPATDTDGNRYPRVSFVRPRGAMFGGSTGLENYRDARYLPFTSLDLQTWERAPLFVESVEALPSNFEERVTLQSQYPYNDSTRFFRVEGRFNPDNFAPGILAEKPISMEDLATLDGLTNIAALPSVSYAIEPGQIIYCEVVGVVNDFDVIGGTAPDGSTRDFVYKSTSPLAGASVHAGLLAEGERGIVKVTFISTQANFIGSYQRIKDAEFFDEARSRNGSSSGEPYSYRIEICACLE